MEPNSLNSQPTALCALVAVMALEAGGSKQAAGARHRASTSPSPLSCFCAASANDHSHGQSEPAGSRSQALGFASFYGISSK